MPVPVHLPKALDGLVLNPALPGDLVGRLLRYRRGFGHVAKRSDLTEDLIAEIIDADWFWLVHSLALNSSLPDTFRMRLARHPHPLVRAAVVVGSGDGTPREVFELLIDDPDTTVRGYLAESGHVPEDLRAALAADPDPKIRATLAQWWTDAPEQVRRTLLTDPVPDVRAAACSTYYARLPHPVPPPDLLPALLADPVTRAGAIRHAALDHDTAAQLARDPAPDVRKQVAAHPQLPPEPRDTLAADPNASVRVVIFGRADTPEPLRAAIHAGIEALSAQPDTLQGLDADDPAPRRNLDNYTAHGGPGHRRTRRPAVPARPAHSLAPGRRLHLPHGRPAPLRRRPRPGDAAPRAPRSRPARRARREVGHRPPTTRCGTRSQTTATCRFLP